MRGICISPGLKSDRWGRVPFAFAAVLLLILSAILSVYIMRINEESAMEIEANVSYYAINEEMGNVEAELRSALEHSGYISGEKISEEFRDLSVEDAIVYSAVLANRIFDHYVNNTLRQFYNKSGYTVSVYLYPTSYTNMSSDGERDISNLPKIVSESNMTNVPAFKRGFEAVYLYMEVPNGSHMDLERVPVYFKLNRTVCITIRHNDYDIFVTKTIHIVREIKPPYFLIRYLSKRWDRASILNTATAMIQTIAFMRAYSANLYSMMGSANNDFFEEFIKGLWEDLRDTYNRVNGRITDAIDGLKESVGEAANSIANFFKDLVDDGDSGGGDGGGDAGESGIKPSAENLTATVNDTNEAALFEGYLTDRVSYTKENFSLIYPEDIKIALMLSIIIEEMRVYYTYDEALLNALVDAVNDWRDGYPETESNGKDISTSDIKSMLGHGFYNKINIEGLVLSIYVKTGLVDNELYIFAPFLDKLSRNGFLRLIGDNWAETLVNMVIKMLMAFFNAAKDMDIPGVFTGFITGNPGGILNSIKESAAEASVGVGYMVTLFNFAVLTMSCIEYGYRMDVAHQDELYAFVKNLIKEKWLWWVPETIDLIVTVLRPRDALAKFILSCAGVIAGGINTLFHTKLSGAELLYIAFFGPFRVEAFGESNIYPPEQSDVKDKAFDDMKGRIEKYVNDFNNVSLLNTYDINSDIADLNTYLTTFNNAVSRAENARNDMQPVPIYNRTEEPHHIIDNDTSHINAADSVLGVLQQSQTVLDNTYNYIENNKSSHWYEFNDNTGHTEAWEVTKGYYEQIETWFSYNHDDPEANDSQAREDFRMAVEDASQAAEGFKDATRDFLRDVWWYEASEDVKALRVKLTNAWSELSSITEPHKGDGTEQSMAEAMECEIKLATILSFNNGKWGEHSAHSNSDFGVDFGYNEPSPRDIQDDLQSADTNASDAKNNYFTDGDANKKAVGTGLFSYFWLVNQMMYQLKVSARTQGGKLYSILKGDYHDAGEDFKKNGVINLSSQDIATSGDDLYNDGLNTRWLTYLMDKEIGQLNALRGELETKAQQRRADSAIIDIYNHNGAGWDSTEVYKWFIQPSFYKLSEYTLETLIQKMGVYKGRAAGMEPGLYPDPNDLENLKNNGIDKSEVRSYPLVQAPKCPIKLHLTKDPESGYYTINISINRDKTTLSFDLTNDGKKYFHKKTLTREFKTLSGNAEDKCWQYLDPFDTSHIDFYNTTEIYRVNTTTLALHIVVNASDMVPYAGYQDISWGAEVGFTNATLKYSIDTPLPLYRPKDDSDKENISKPVSELILKIGNVNVYPNVISVYNMTHDGSNHINVSFDASPGKKYRVEVWALIQNDFVPAVMQGAVNLLSGLFGDDSYSNYKKLTETKYITVNKDSENDFREKHVRVEFGGGEVHWNKLLDHRKLKDTEPLLIVKVSADVSFQYLVSAYSQKDLCEDGERKYFSIIPAVSSVEQCFIVATNSDNAFYRKPYLPVFDVYPKGKEGNDPHALDIAWDANRAMDSDLACQFTLIRDIAPNSWVVDKNGMNFLVSFTHSQMYMRNIVSGSAQAGKMISKTDEMAFSALSTAIPVVGAAATAISFAIDAFFAAQPKMEYKYVISYDFVPVIKAAMKPGARGALAKLSLDIGVSVNPEEMSVDVSGGYSVEQDDLYYFFPERALPLNIYRPWQAIDVGQVWDRWGDYIINERYHPYILVDPKWMYGLQGMLGKGGGGNGKKALISEGMLGHAVNGIQMFYGTTTGFMYDEGMDFGQGYYIVYDITKPRESKGVCEGAVAFSRSVAGVIGITKDALWLVKKVSQAIGALKAVGALERLGKIGKALDKLNEALEKVDDVTSKGYEAYLEARDPDAQDAFYRDYVLPNMTGLNEDLVNKVRDMRANGSLTYDMFTISVGIELYKSSTGVSGDDEGEALDFLARLNTEFKIDNGRNVQFVMGLEGVDLNNLTERFEGWYGEGVCDIDNILGEMEGFGVTTYDDFQDIEALPDALFKIMSATGMDTMGGVSEIKDFADLYDQISTGKADDTLASVYNVVKGLHRFGLEVPDIERLAALFGSNFIPVAEAMCNEEMMNVSGFNTLLRRIDCMTTLSYRGEIGGYIFASIGDTVEVLQRSIAALREGKSAHVPEICLDFVSVDNRHTLPVVETPEGYTLHLNMTGCNDTTVLSSALAQIIPNLNGRATINVTVSWDATTFESRVVAEVIEVLEDNDPLGVHVGYINVFIEGEGYIGAFTNALRPEYHRYTYM